MRAIQQSTACPTNTPWGPAQTIKEIIPGIYNVSTSSHGGFFVEPERLAKMPTYLRSTTYSRGGWFEEDCDWCIPFTFFWKELEPAVSPRYKQEDCVRTFRHQYPDKYEQYFKVTLQPGESHERDRATYMKTIADKLQVTSAQSGTVSWFKRPIPPGMVACVARRGGHDQNASASNPDRWFLVPAVEYQNRPEFGGFIIDPSKHEEVDPLTT